jgi:hypothetical protein
LKGASAFLHPDQFRTDLFQATAVGFPLLRQKSGNFGVEFEMGGGFLAGLSGPPFPRSSL